MLTCICLGCLLRLPVILRCVLTGGYTTTSITPTSIVRRQCRTIPVVGVSEGVASTSQGGLHMSLRKVPRFYHITHDLQIVWVIWDIYVGILHVGQIVRNLDYLPYNKDKPPYESVLYGQDFERVREGHLDEESALVAFKRHLASSHPSHRLAGNTASP